MSQNNYNSWSEFSAAFAQEYPELYDLIPPRCNCEICKEKELQLQPDSVSVDTSTIQPNNKTPKCP